MKKLLMIFVSIMLLFTLSGKAQITSSWALSAQGGYSWINGVVGGDLQIGNFGFGLGWMPTSMPLYGDKISSIGYNVTYYSNLYYEYGYYVSLGQATKGYRYESSSGSEYAIPMTIIMAGIKSGSDSFYMKAGLGYGWCDHGNSWTGEITIGIPLFTDYSF